MDKQTSSYPLIPSSSTNNNINQSSDSNSSIYPSSTTTSTTVPSAASTLILPQFTFDPSHTKTTSVVDSSFLNHATGSLRKSGTQSLRGSHASSRATKPVLSRVVSRSGNNSNNREADDDDQADKPKQLNLQVS